MLPKAALGDVGMWDVGHNTDLDIANQEDNTQN